jgi:16S rRNA (cytosine967-C5)-methyltransferase
VTQNPRQLAFLALRSVHQGAFADVALDKTLRQAKLTNLLDRRLLTELVYGSVRRQRTLDALIDQLAKKPAQQQPGDLRTILHLGLYQLRFLNQIPASAAVNTTVDLAKQNGFAGLTGFVNGVLRQYVRLREAEGAEEAGEARQNSELSSAAVQGATQNFLPDIPFPHHPPWHSTQLPRLDGGALAGAVGGRSNGATVPMDEPAAAY